MKRPAGKVIVSPVPYWSLRMRRLVLLAVLTFAAATAGCGFTNAESKPPATSKTAPTKR